MNKSLNVVEILWTGGFDSTFRVVQLSKFEIEIQPYYLSDNRQSEKNELQAITDITELLKKHPNTRCDFRPLIYVSMASRVEDKKITDTYRRMLQKDFFGSQYDWLARFAKNHKGIELSIHQDDKAILLIKKYGKIKTIYDDICGKNFVLDTEASSKDLCTLFQDFRFPLEPYRKLAMKQYYIENGYTDIMNKTWFCFTPINGKPCGKCNPCKYTIEEGMGERFTFTAKMRYACRKFTNMKV